MPYQWLSTCHCIGTIHLTTSTTTFLLQSILSFNLPPAAAAAHVAALHRLSSAGACSTAGGADQWGKQVYAVAHEVLHRYVSTALPVAAVYFVSASCFHFFVAMTLYTLWLRCCSAYDR